MFKSRLERWVNFHALEWLKLWPEAKRQSKRKENPFIFRYLLPASILWNKTVSGMSVSVILFDRRSLRYQSWKKTSASLITAASAKETKRKSLWTRGSGPEAQFLLFTRTRSRTSWLRCGQQRRLVNPFSVRDLCQFRRLFTTWDLPHTYIRWWEANTSVFTPQRTPTSCTLINPSCFTTPVRWDWQPPKGRHVHLADTVYTVFLVSVSLCAGGSGESGPGAVPGVCQGSLSRMRVAARRRPVHPRATLALRPIAGAQLLRQLLVVLTAGSLYKKSTFCRAKMWVWHRFLLLWKGNQSGGFN